MPVLRLLYVLIVFSVAATSLPALAGGPAEAFYGHFVGKAIDQGADEIENRDLEVHIRPYKNGFNVEWTTTIHRSSGKVKRAAFSINFRPTQQDGVFSSAMRKDKFGNARPLDPLKGDPYVWAVIEGGVLTVNTLIILDEGGYEIQTYERRIIDDGMYLEFSRIRNGEKLKDIRAKLLRVAQ